MILHGDMLFFCMIKPKNRKENVQTKKDTDPYRTCVPCGICSFVRSVSGDLSLGELGRATSGFETVFLSFLHTRVSREEAGLLQEGAVRIVGEKELTGYAVTDRACLTGDAAALNVGNDVILADSIGNAERLVDNELEGFQTEIIVDVTTVDGDLAGTGIQTNAGDGALSSAGTVEIRLCAGV